jgi:hypothetical protein
MLLLDLEKMAVAIAVADPRRSMHPNVLVGWRVFGLWSWELEQAL